MLLPTNVDKILHLWLMFYCVIFKKKNEQNFANCVLPEKMPIQWHNLQFFNFIFFHGDITLLLSVKLQCFIIVFLFIHYDLGLLSGRPHKPYYFLFQKVSSLQGIQRNSKAASLTPLQMVDCLPFHCIICILVFTNVWTLK